jgi:hypothetical protein
MIKICYYSLTLQFFPNQTQTQGLGSAPTPRRALRFPVPGIGKAVAGGAAGREASSRERRDGRRPREQ